MYRLSCASLSLAPSRVAVSELEGLVELHTLELSSNCLPTVRCASLVALEELWLSDNQMAAPEHIDEITGLPLLKTLYLTGCPISKRADYRSAVLGAAPPTLEQLDADQLPKGWRDALPPQPAAAAAASASPAAPAVPEEAAGS